MACNADFVQYIVDQCSGAGVITVRKMMGDYCIYCNGVLFGLICDNNFYVKVTEAGEAVLEEVELRQPYEGAKDYFFVSNVDNRDYLEDIVKATLPELLSPKAKARKQARKNRQVPVSLDEVIATDLVCSQDPIWSVHRTCGPSSSSIWARISASRWSSRTGCTGIPALRSGMPWRHINNCFRPVYDGEEERIDSSAGGGNSPRQRNRRGLLERVDGEGAAACVGLAGEGGDPDAVLVRDLHFGGRQAMMGAGQMPFRSERVSFPRRNVVVDGRIDGESEIFALIDQRSEHQISQGEDGATLAYTAGIKVGRCHFQFSDGRTGGDFHEPGSAARSETVACVEVIL